MNKHWMRLMIVLLALGAVALMIHDFLRVDVGVGVFRTEPPVVMGTDTEVTVVTTRELAAEALSSAEVALRNVETRMSRHLEASALSRLNAAAAGQAVTLPVELMDLLRVSRELAEATQGAFDVTCLPIIDAWKQADKQGRRPSEDELAAAMALAGWEHFGLGDGTVTKDADGARIDLGGVAKGYGIDRAVWAMLEVGTSGGLVNVGGDVRGFGGRPGGEAWIVGIRSPFDESVLLRLAIRNAAVCTSGNYERHIEIDGKRYSHIVDPRTGRPAEMTPSVTVIAPTATLADAWATALSVLGADGLELIEKLDGVEAMLVLGTPDEYELKMTSGFEKYRVRKSSRD